MNNKHKSTLTQLNT